MSVTRVKTSAGWVDLQTVGPPGPSGPTGPTGLAGSVEVYEQPGAPASPGIGALWVDTDESPGIVSHQQFSVGTTFPTTPPNGSIHVYPCDAITGIWGGGAAAVGPGLGVSWQFVYVSADNDWRWIGGPPIQVQSDGNIRTGGNTSYAAVGTETIEMGIPLKGDWDFEINGWLFDQTGGGFNGVNLSWSLTGYSAASDTWSANIGWGGNQWSTVSARTRHTITTSGQLAERVRCSAGGWGVANRRLRAWPVRYTP